ESYGSNPGLHDIACCRKYLLLRCKNVPQFYPDRTEWRQVAQSDPGRYFEYTLPRQSRFGRDPARVGEDDEGGVLQDEVGIEARLRRDERGAVATDRNVARVLLRDARPARAAHFRPLLQGRVPALEALPSSEEPLRERARQRILIGTFQDERAILRPGGEDAVFSERHVAADLRL